MKASFTQNLLSAQFEGRRVTIGLNEPEELRRLSDARMLTCPGCGATVVLHAGTVRAHHFAHLPGAECRLPQTEPETEEHRAGKLLVAQWLRERLPDAEVIVEAFLPETNQRADVMAILPGRTKRQIALEFQCANLSAREWRRRHRQYRSIGVEDLWLLGGSRVHRTEGQREKKNHGGHEGHGEKAKGESKENNVTLRTTELERALLWDGAPLLFLDAEGVTLKAGTLARFRPDVEAQALQPQGRFSVMPLLTLDFPMALLDWPNASHPDAPVMTNDEGRKTKDARHVPGSDFWLWEWLATRHRVTPETLPGFFGLPLEGSEAFACEARAWQAAIYYRFVHRRVGDSWWLVEVETWARAYLPLARPLPLPKLKKALANYQEALSAAGLLSLPMGYGRVNARVQADLTTLDKPPDAEETLRLVRYRRTLAREAAAEYNASS